jgi:hypothetical protein
MKPIDSPPPKAPAGRDRPPAPAHHATTEELHNEDVAHEHSDVNIRAILLFGIGMAVVTAISAAVVAGAFVLFERQAAANDPRLSPLAGKPTQMPATTTGSPFFGGAPQPQLLTNEPGLLQRQRQREAQVLGGYDWVDQRAGVARLPIDAAKKLILERGLPARADQVPDPRLGTSAPARGEASGGQALGRGGS